MISDLVIEKIDIIKRCLTRIERVTDGRNPFSLGQIDKQDLFVLNLQRAVQASIDLANTVIRKKKWSIPNSYRDSFEILKKHQVLTSILGNKMQRMCGFRNIAIHEYRKIDLNILKSIFAKRVR